MNARPGLGLLDDAPLLSELTCLIYDAAIDPGIWPRFLERLGKVLELHSISFVMSSTMPDGQVGALPATWGHEDAVVADYQAHYARIDPHRQRAVHLPAGTVAVADQLLPDDEFVLTEYFNEFYAPSGMRHGFAAILHNERGMTSGLTGHRGHDRPPPGALEIAFLGLITPHLQRARSLSVKLGTLSSHEHIVDDVLDRLPIGLVFFDAKGSFLRANTRGERILLEHDGLGVARGQLVTDGTRNTRLLQQMIGKACSNEPARMDGPMNLRLERPSGRRELEVMACPIDPASEAWSDGRAAAFLVVSDGEAELTSAAGRLRDLYGLSDAESKLAVALARGITVKQWAEKRRVSIETVRWQLKQVFGKTGVSRQSDLMRLVLLGPALAS